MNKNITLIVFVLIAGINICTSQTSIERQKITKNYNQVALSELEAELQQKFDKQYHRAISSALINGWEIEKKLDSGGTLFLVGLFPDGSPMYYTTENREAGITTKTNTLHSGGSLGLNINGENMIAGIWDGGLIRSTHQIFNNRIQQIDNPSNITNHGTHVAGTMIGNGDVTNGEVKGMAHLASLIAYDFSGDEAEMTAAASAGLLISNHAYGIPASNSPLWYLGFYDSNARDLDEIIYNAPYYLPVCSAGNDRQTGTNPNDGGYDYLTDKSLSKNNIVVAGVNEILNYTGPSDVVMSNFSSWGPTDDGRIKPDISAKGIDMLSSGGAADDSYTIMAGTSMATANVSGSLLLLQQYYNQLNSDYMLAATLRALVLNTADEAGNSPGPDYKFGWGLLNMERAANVITNNGITSNIIETSINSNDTFSLPISVNNLTEITATIAWTDPEGNVLPSGNNDVTTPSLVNDLDIVITEDTSGTSYLPWTLDVNNPSNPAVKGINNVDNIETIQFIPPNTGNYTLTVTHKGTSLQSGSQAFSIVLSDSNLTLNSVENDIIGLTLYPNPTSSALTISAAVSLDTVEIYSVLGEQISTVTLDGNSTTLDISSLAAGTYFVKITSQDTSAVKQIIKQ